MALIDELEQATKTPARLADANHVFHTNLLAQQPSKEILRSVYFHA